MSETYYKTVIFDLKPDMSIAFQDLMKKELVAARDFKGCQYLAMLADTEQPQKVLLYMIWDSLQASQKYLQWRKETGFSDLIRPYLAAPPSSSSYKLVQD